MLCLLNDVVPGCVPASKYFVESYFFNDNSKTEMHYYCLKFESCLGTNEDSPFKYLICNDATQITASTCQKADHYFLVHPLKDKLAYLLEKKNLAKLLEKQKKKSKTHLLKREKSILDRVITMKKSKIS